MKIQIHKIHKDTQRYMKIQKDAIDYTLLSVFLLNHFGPVNEISTAPIGAVTTIASTAIVNICMPINSFDLFGRACCLAMSKGMEPIAA